MRRIRLKERWAQTAYAFSERESAAFTPLQCPAGRPRWEWQALAPIPNLRRAKARAPRDAKQVISGRRHAAPFFKIMAKKPKPIDRLTLIFRCVVVIDILGLALPTGWMGWPADFLLALVLLGLTAGVWFCQWCLAS